MIRLATKKDLPELKRLLRSFFEKSPYSSMEYSEEKVESLLLQFLENTSENLVIVLDPSDDATPGVPQGLLIAIVTEVPFSREKIATEMAWFVEPTARGKESMELLYAFEYWAKKIGCVRTSMSSLGDDRVAKIYTKNGYQNAEISFLKEL